MSEVKYIIGKSASSLYEEIGGKRPKELEQLDFNTEDEITNYFCKIKNPAKIDFVPLLQYWQNQTNLEDIQGKLKIGSIKEIHFDVTDNFNKGNSNVCKLTSNTDVLCLGDDFRISVEGKYKEFRNLALPQKSIYPTIKEMKVGRQPIIQKIEDNWLEAIQDFCNPDITRIDDLQYQFLLRLVDACINNPARAIVLYQFFSEENFDVNEWLVSLKEWELIINPNERLSIFAQVIHVEGIDQNASVEEIIQKTKDEKFNAFQKKCLIQF